MAFKAKVYNKEYPIKDGFTIKSELNETLDSGIIQFNTYGEELDAVPFDNVQIFDTNNKIVRKHFDVNMYDDEVFSFGDDLESSDHLYTVPLFSETKKLERITMPNFSITQPIDENATQKSVYDEILRAYQLYVPIIRVYNDDVTSKWSYQREFALDPAIQTKFSGVVCPELQWNNATLREVLNDLMSTLDCIVILKQGIISFYDVKEKGLPIDTSKLNYSKKTMNADDYVNQLTIDIQNAIGKNKTICCEYISLHAPDGSATMTTENAVLTTQHPIYGIKKLIVYAFDDSTYGDGNPPYYCLHKIDVVSRVKEYDEWNLYSEVKIGGTGTAFQDLPNYTDANNVTTKVHKVNFLYYKRGGQEICNMGNVYPVWVTTIPRTFVESVIVGTCINKGTLVPGQKLGGNNDPRSFFFYIEYETVTDHAMDVGKYLPSRHYENKIFDSQENSYVDIEHQSIFEYAKVNRLGNKLREIRGEYFNESDIPELGDYIGDEILFSKEVSYYDNIYLFKGFLTPHYVLKDFFTGVRAKKRSWQIAQKQDALTRHDILKLYVEASFNQKTDYRLFDDVLSTCKIVSYSSSGNIIEQFVSLASSYSNVNVKWTLGLTAQPLNISDATFVVLDTGIEIQGMSLCFNYGYNDNYKAADYITKEDNEYIQSFYPYANDNGEFDGNQLFSFVSSLYNSNLYDLPTPLEDGGDATTDHIDMYAWDDIIESIYQRPLISYSELDTNANYLTFNLNLQKDNREIIKNTVQIEYCSDTADIIVTPKTVGFSKLYKSVHNPLINFIFYGSETDTYKIGDELHKGTLRGWKFRQEILSDQSIKLVVTTLLGADVNPEGLKSWCVTDLAGNIILAVNVQEGQSTLNCIFNLLRIRDDKVYSNYYGGEVIGDITPTGLASLTTNYNNRNVAEENSQSTVRVLRRNVGRNN